MSVVVQRRGFVLGGALVALTRPARAESITVFGRFSTTYLHDAEHKPRATNVELATAAIDGRILGPGAIFSFNDAVGERTLAFGFAKSIVLRDGMIAEGVGGGTCQVASTLHAAALLAGLDVVFRAPHSRPSAYIRMGLDAAVVFGSIDLKLRNPGAMPVTVRARANAGVLDVHLEGAGPRPDVTLASEIVERMPFVRTTSRDRTVVDGQAHLATFGIPGYRVRRTRTVRWPEQPIRHDVRIDVYPPTNALVRIGPGFDRPLDEDGEPTRVEAEVIDRAAVRPAPVQLRPSTLVTLDNGAP